ncbi:MAG: SoxR reducing system RseC family protein [Elusimicrobiota bacterium]
MEEVATVVSILNNKLTLSFSRQKICKKCGICQKSKDNQMYLEIENSIDAKVGNTVLLKIKPSNLKISFIIYGLPILFFIVGIFIGIFLFRKDLYGFFTGVLFLIFSILLVKNFADKHKLKIEKITVVKNEI